MMTVTAQVDTLDIHTTFLKSGKINLIRLAPILGATGNRETKMFLGADAPRNIFVSRNFPECSGDGWEISTNRRL
jgi:hypothetical protein